MKYNSLANYAFLIFLIGIISCSKEDNDVNPGDEDDIIPTSLSLNEIHSTGNPDWIEIYNYGDITIDIGGFTIYDKEDNKYVLPSGNNIKPDGFLILNSDDQGVGLNLPFKLTSKGEEITLLDPDGIKIDNIIFPAMKNGQTYARFPDGIGSWEITGIATKNTTNGSGAISFFKSYNYSPEIPMVNDDIAFALELSNGSGISKLELFYSIDDGAFQSIKLTSSDNTNFEATVPALVTDGELTYYFKLTDDGGNEVLLPDDAIKDPYDITITSGDVPNLVINEILASNQQTLLDPDGTDEYDDWIEIYNAGSTAIDMGRFYFSDSENPFDDRIPGDNPTKTTIEPGGYLLFWADSDTEQGSTHLKFKLSTEGEILSLYYKDGRLIDTHTFGEQSADISEGRSPNGGDTWKKINPPSPEKSNQ